MDDDFDLPFNAEDPRLGPNRGIGSDIAYIRTDKGEILKGSARNVELLLAFDDSVAGRIKRNLLSDVIDIELPVPWEPTGTGRRPLVDSDYFRCQTWAETKGVFASRNCVQSAIQAQAWADAYHPVREYLLSLAWDGEPRLERLLLDRFGAAPEAPANPDPDDCRAFNDELTYLQAVARCWLISAVARAMRPGCKVDTLVILEGEQGIFKSQGVAALAGDWGCDSQIDFSSKDGIMLMHSAWIVEIAEFDHIRGRDFSTIKAWLSRSTDKLRRPYGIEIENRPRPSIMVGSTNAFGYLNDDSGARRFWPVRCRGDIDLAGIVQDRDQLWAEAMALYSDGAQWWLSRPEEAIAAEMQSDRQIEDSWEGIVLRLAEQLSAGRGWVTASDILAHGYTVEGRPEAGHIGKHVADTRKIDLSRVSSVLRQGGWEKMSRRRVGGDRVRPWRNPRHSGELVWGESW